MSIRELAKADWLAGMKPGEIAQKYNVSVNTVKSWITRHWKKEAGAPAPAPAPPEKVHPLQEVHPEKNKGGAPLGNTNARGNKGGGAPPGNSNRLTHGAYTKKQYSALLSSDTLDYLVGQEVDSLALINQKITDLRIQEAYYLERITVIKTRYQGGMGIHDAVKRTSYLRTGVKDEESVTTRTLAVDDLLHPLYVELNKVQRLLLAAVREKETIKLNLRRMELAERKVPPPPEENPDETAMKNLSEEELRALAALGGGDG